MPAGRYRTIGKWVICALLAVTALSRLYLAQDHPTDIVAGVILGVAVPLAAFRLADPQRRVPGDATGAAGPRTWTSPASAARRSSGRCRTSSACSPPR